MSENEKNRVPVTVSLIVHRNFSYIADAVRSIYATTTTPPVIYVIINAGTEAETAAFRATFPEVQVIVNEKPVGFAANHNQIMRCAETAFVALLNDDIRLHDGALDTLLAYLQSHPDVGLVGGQLFNADGSKQVSVYSDPGLLRSIYKISGLASLTHQRSPLRRWLLRLGLGRLLHVESLVDNERVRDVPIIKGAVMVVRRAAYEQVGLMDETTLAYGEEADWHLRLRKAGWRVVFVPDAHITHYGQGQATLSLQGQSLIEDRRATLHYYHKHRPMWQAALIRGVIVISHGFWGGVWLAFNRQKSRVHFATAALGLRPRRRLPG